MLLIQNLRVGEALIAYLTEVGRAHYLLRHHEIVLLWSVDSFLTLDGPHSILRVLGTSSDIADGANASNSSWHILLAILLDGPWPVRVLATDLWTIALKPNHASTDAHYSVIIVGVEILTRILCYLTVVDIILSLISEPPTHHRLHSMGNISAHYNIVLLNHCDTTVCVLLILLLRPSMVLLSLDNVATEHLWIFYFDLRVVENVVIVVYVFNYFNWLLTVALFLWL